jgi:hypothetical protein
MHSSTVAYQQWKDQAEEVWRESAIDEVPRKSEQARFSLAYRMRKTIEDRNPLSDPADVYSILLEAAISEVNWEEIANDWLTLIEGYERVKYVDDEDEKPQE